MMSARVVFFAAVGIYTSMYLLLVRSVPRNKSGINFVSRLRVHFATTDWSAWSDCMQACFSLGTVVLYLVDSYYQADVYVTWAVRLEIIFTVFFAFNFALELLLSKNRWAHFMSLLSIVDLVTIVPVFVAIASDAYEESPTGFVRLYRVLMLPRVFKPLRLLRAVETLSPGEDAVMEQTIRAMAYFVSILFIASGLVQALSIGRTEDWGDLDESDSEEAPMAFHDALYFIIVTFSTVGYGDISPPDTQSRLVVVVLVGFFFFMIPRELNKLNQLLDLSSKYTGWYPKKLSGGHIIVGCDVASCGLVAAFLEEFFHADHGYNAKHLVLLVPQEPTVEWKRLVLKFAANDRVTYLKGDLRSTNDLARVWTHTASSCFILSNRYGNLKEEEKRGFMRAINVQDFNPHIRIFVQALTVGMRNRLVKVGINPARIVCACTINTRMLANACAWEGASTLVNNLLVSASIDEQRDMPSWLKEYAFGLGKEIYVVSIGVFSGRGFSEIVMQLFNHHGVVLLGISEDCRVLLHPGADYTISQSDLGFLIADDADVAESIVEQAGALLSAIPNKKRASPSGNPSAHKNGRGSAARAGGRDGAAGSQPRSLLPRGKQLETINSSHQRRHQHLSRSQSPPPSRRRRRQLSLFGLQGGDPDDINHYDNDNDSSDNIKKNKSNANVSNTSAATRHEQQRQQPLQNHEGVEFTGSNRRSSNTINGNGPGRISFSEPGETSGNSAGCGTATNTPLATPAWPQSSGRHVQDPDLEDTSKTAEATNDSPLLPPPPLPPPPPPPSSSLFSPARVQAEGGTATVTHDPGPSSSFFPPSFWPRYGDGVELDASTETFFPVGGKRNDREGQPVRSSISGGCDDAAAHARGSAMHISRTNHNLVKSGQEGGWDFGGGGRVGATAEPSGHIVLVTPSLSDVSTLVEALEAPQVPAVEFVVVCPMYPWRGDRDEDELELLKKFPQVRLIVGSASVAALREAGANRARMVVVRTGRSFPEQEGADADAETIGQLVEVIAVAGEDVRVVVELNDMTYGNQYEILVNHMRQSVAAAQAGISKLGQQSSRSNNSACASVMAGIRGAARSRSSSPKRRKRRKNAKLKPRKAKSKQGNRINGSEKGGNGKSRERISQSSAGSNRWLTFFKRSGSRLSSSSSLTSGTDGVSGSCRTGGVSGGGGRGIAGIPASAGQGAGRKGAQVDVSKSISRSRGGMHWSLSDGFASGAVVPNNLPETLLCQAFYNPTIIMIVEALLDPSGQNPYRRQRQNSLEFLLENDRRDPIPDSTGRRSSTSILEFDEKSGVDSVGFVKRGMALEGRGSGQPGRRTAGSTGGASFLAQIAPPRRFFSEAMISGNRPNFQELMSFMLREYDALPFGLLRHGKRNKTPQFGSSLSAVTPSGGVGESSPMFVHCCPQPGQKVMPLDKVFLLAPNQRSWQRMCRECPVPPQRCTSQHRHATRQIPTPNAPRGANVSRSANESRSLGGTSLPGGGYAQDDSGGVMGGDAHMLPPRVRSLQSDFASHAESRERGAREGPFKERFPDISGEQSQEWPGSLSFSPRRKTNATSIVMRTGGGIVARSPCSEPKGKMTSHAKLDVLLSEVRRMNGRLHWLTHSLGALEETKRRDVYDDAKELG